ncbi:MAG TPA: hypothetical protein VK034_14725 [Enhygromyxa sp.]|nr:hypothetical protein [Enhygromyxa sp.]
MIEYADPEVAGTNLTLGSKIHGMTDQEILDVHNGILETINELRATTEHVAREIPVGRPQLEYSARCDQWVPRGDVVRCVVTCDDNGRALVDIDGREFTMEEFGKMFLTYEGWGMRLTFVEEEHVDESPAIEICEPDDDDGAGWPSPDEP